VRLRFGLALLALATGAVAVVLAIFLVHGALGDGDPASDYLISQQLFLPYRANLSSANASKLSGILDDAKQKGFPLKVAVIAGRYDLGSVPSLFGKPEEYARFLGQEDYYFFKSPLLVVMPQGFGFYNHGHPVQQGDRKVLAALPAPNTTSIDALVASADRAVRALAARRGLTLSAGSSSGSSAWRDRLVIVAAVLVLLAVGVAVRAVVRR
jgi:hypothetical protein